MSTVVHIEHLTVRYGDYSALNDISIDVEQGDFVTILGPNGAGKSTLFKTILGLIRANEGVVEVFGKRVEEIDSSTIAYVPQIKTLDRSFPALAIELVMTGLNSAWPVYRHRARNSKVWEALTRVGAEHLAERPLVQLSGGELQRIYLARGIVRNPSLVLLDEPATGIDARGVEGLYDILYNYQRDSGVTILMITHDWEVAFHHANRVLLLNSDLIAYGAPVEALTDDFLRRTFGHVGHQHAMLIGGTPHA